MAAAFGWAQVLDHKYLPALPPIKPWPGLRPESICHQLVNMTPQSSLITVLVIPVLISSPDPAGATTAIPSPKASTAPLVSSTDKRPSAKPPAFLIHLKLLR